MSQIHLWTKVQSLEDGNFLPLTWMRFSGALCCCAWRRKKWKAWDVLKQPPTVTFNAVGKNSRRGMPPYDDPLWGSGIDDQTVLPILPQWSGIVSPAREKTTFSTEAEASYQIILKHDYKKNFYIEISMIVICHFVLYMKTARKANFLLSQNKVIKENQSRDVNKL